MSEIISSTGSNSPADREFVDPSAPLLEIKDLDVSFTSDRGTEVPAARGVNLTVYPGQTVAIVGESGSGKSTTAHAIIDLLPGTGKVTGGQILFEGRDITKLRRREMEALRGDAIGLVPQDPMSNLNPVWKIGHQVSEALRANGRAKGSADAKRQAAQLLGEAGLGDAERRLKQYPHEFSGGMRQRTLIAIGLAARPKLLIADEPTSALDVTVQRQILDHLETLTADLGTAVLLITHDLGLAAERAEHLVVMYRGRVVESGNAREILADPQHPYTRRLVASAPSLSARRADTAASRAEVVERAEQIADAAAQEGGTLSADVTPEAVVGAAPHDVLTIENLTKVFKIRGAGARAAEFKAVDEVSFTVRRGTTTAVVGESGSGKSTLAQMVLRLQTPTAGRVLFDGVDVTAFGRKEQFAFRRRVQPIFQNPYGSLDPTYSIYRTIEEPLRLHGAGDKKAREATVREMLDRVSLPSSVMRRYPNELSGGQRQRIAIARALALRPDVVVCDEAVSALDVLVQAQILDLLSELQAELGLTYLFITHDLAVVRQIADRVCVMQNGKLVEEADTDAVFDHPQQEYTRTLLNAIPGAGLITSGDR
ncbi:MAG: dipeptide ABC transporter ATP-binding protein [Blastococcus sp.]